MVSEVGVRRRAVSFLFLAFLSAGLCFGASALFLVVPFFCLSCVLVLAEESHAGRVFHHGRLGTVCSCLSRASWIRSIFLSEHLSWSLRQGNVLHVIKTEPSVRRVFILDDSDELV